MRYVFLTILVPFQLFAVDFYRVLYEDDDMLKQLKDNMPLLERAYGSKLYVIKGKPKAKADVVDGIVLHTDDAEDPKWVIGKEGNPATEKTIKELGDKLGDKYVEYKWLTDNAPKDMHPPETVLTSEFAKAGTKSTQIEKIRQKMFDRLGKALLKIRISFHSEGRLPKTTDNWRKIWKGYSTKTKPTITRIKKKLRGSSVELQNKIYNLPFIEGRILEEVLKHPTRVVAQKMIKINKEVRLHVINGKVIKGATTLRFYPLGQYLNEDEIEDVEAAMQRFVDGLPKDIRSHYSSGTDIAIDEKGNKVLLDLNTGYESGYLFPEEDLYTTNLIAQYFTRKSTPFLDEFSAFRKATLADKLALLKKMENEYRPFLGDEGGPESFWDRVGAEYIKALKANPTPATYDQILTHFQQAGLEEGSIFYQFCAQAQNELQAKLTPRRAADWVKTLSELDPDVKFSQRAGQLEAVMVEEN